MKKYLITIFLAVMLLAGCTGADRSVATVNGEPITKVEYDLRVKKMAVVFEAQGQQIDRQELEKQVLESLISEKVIAQAAKEKGINVPEKEAREELKKVKGNFKTEEDWKAILDSRHLTEADMVKYLHDKLVAEGLIEELGGAENYDAYISEMIAKAKVEKF